MKVAVALLVALLAPAAKAAFEPAIYSARAAAMGAAMTAVGDDPVSLYYNPGALGTIDSPAASVGYLRQFHSPAGAVNQDVYGAAAAVPVKQEIINGTFGFSTVHNRQIGVGLERSFALGFGTRGLWQSDDRRLEAGGSLKLLKKTLEQGGGAPLRAALDAGVLFRWSERYAAGLSLLNLNGPSTSAGGLRDRAPAEIRIGVSEAARGFVFGLDLAKREPSGRHPGSGEIAAGFERWWATARAGSYAARTGLSVGDRDKTWSWGLGWRVFGGQVDYAMTVPMTGVTLVGHAVSVSLRFGQSNPEAEYEKVLAAEVGYRRDLVTALESGEVKQWKLAEELSRLRQELDVLRGELVDKSASETEAKRRIKDLQERHQKAMDTYQRLKGDSEKLANKTKKTLFDEDWAAYQKLKLNGAPDAMLVDHVNRILRRYKDTGVDLSGANQELLRLLRAK